MADYVVSVQDLPVCAAQRAYRGDTYRGDPIKHSNPDGSPIDTSGWTITGAIYERRACGAAVVQALTIEKELATPWGYRATLTPAQTSAIPCGSYWYEIETNDGTTVRTYVGGTFTVEGVG